MGTEMNLSTDLGEPKPRYEYYAGLTSAPGGCCNEPMEFLKIAPARTSVAQRVLYMEGYNIWDGKGSLAQRAGNFSLLEEAAMCLGQCSCAVVGQAGTNWVHCTGTTPDQIEDIIAEISEKAQTKFYMAGHSLVRALREIGAKKIAVANGYYRPEWRDGINRYLEQAGFEILASGNIVDYGLFKSYDEIEKLERATLWDYPMKNILDCLVAAHEAAPDADVVVQTGAGMRTLDILEVAEAATGKMMVCSDNALYWEMLRGLGAKGPQTGYGALLKSA
jgi:maleate cis-trans isomerase